ncbi:MAG: hypothetical protein Q8880_09770, partial [Bacteroidota bacterium]|nr:hypothetical protein [Bacteroidota bacterium]
MRSRLIYIIAFLIFLLNTDFILGTTPPNDNCVNASDISIGKDGFGFGVFKSKTINISDATVQPGEYFDPVLLSSGNNKKSVWFKFTIPTTRGVKIELKQKGGSIPENGAGFVTYYSSGKNPPGSTDITTSKITPMGQFGSAFNPCLYAGTYYIQVGANNNSNDSIYVELSVTRPNNLNSYDYTSSALDFGVVPDFNSAYYTFDAGCQTIDTISEVCSSVLGADYKDYTSTAWFTFNTGDAFDYLKFNLGLKNFGQPYSSSNPLVIGYKLYKGNVKKDGLSRITLFRDCSKFEQTSATLPNFQFNCSELQPHTSYTVQVFFNKFFSGTILTYINKIGRVTNAPNPRNIPFSNKDIILNHSNAGITNTFNDAFGCNSFMKDYLCGTVVPLNYSYNKLIYDMNTWYTFTLQKDANLVISAKCSGILVYMRLYKGNVSSDCNLSLYSDFASNTSMTCIPAGSYSLQILGVSGQGSASDILYDVNSQLGRDITLNVTVTDAVSINRFNLSDANSVNRLSLNPIKSDTIIYALSDTFGCQNTVLPIGPQCDTLVNKAIYRVISLDRDGILTVDKRDDKIPYRIYSGDVSTLASVQNKFKPTDRISGLTIIKPCSGNGSSFKFCVSKGTYTIVSFGNDRDLNTPDPQLVVRYNTIKSYFKDTLHPEDMGDITDKFNFGRFYSKTDYVSCENNSTTIDNLAPCSNYNNLIYRQFYINKEKVFSLSGILPFRLFAGKVSSGTNSLKAITPDCKMSWNREYCLSLQPGWYTIVSYGSNLSNGNLGDHDSITVTPERKPKHNRPYKAAFNKLDWGTSTSGTKYPSTGKYIVLDNDVFNCVPDTPIAGACSGKFQKVVYYSFTIARNSFIAIKDVPSEMKVKVFPFDVRTDSALLYTAPPIQPCISSAPYSIQFCNLQPGSYTLVIYAIPVSIRWVQPTVYIDRVEDSRFDNAYNAYDFGKVVGDNTFHYGKVGDVNAFDTGRNPTNDFISCKTGAQPTDPDNYYTDLTNKNHCTTGIYPSSG